MNIGRPLLLLLVSVFAWTHGVAAEGRPNIVIIFLDDSGWSDFHPFGNPPYPTPNVERLAAEGGRYNNFFVPQAVCSASRAALLIKYPGHIKAGMVSSATFCSVDLLPTLCALSGAALPANEIDGRWKLHLPHGYRHTVTPGVDGHAGTIETLKIELSLFDLQADPCLLYTSPSPRDRTRSRMPSSA